MLWKNNQLTNVTNLHSIHPRTKQLGNKISFHEIKYLVSIKSLKHFYYVNAN